MSSKATNMIGIAKEYFRRGDAGDPEVLALFTDDATIYFPKFGIGTGKTALGELAAGLMRSLRSLSHDVGSFTYHESKNSLIVEGTTEGVAADGRTWSGGQTSGGRFCSVFDFRDELISRMYIYLDPDYLGDDTGRFLWGTEDRSW